jgi:hypothetical protein
MGDSGARPGGGIGEPIDTPDPLTKYKWWILGGLALLLAAAAAFLLRRKADAAPNAPSSVHDDLSSRSSAQQQSALSVSPEPAPMGAPLQASGPVSNTLLLHVLKEELFAIESEKLSGTLSAAEYAKVKTGLEAVLKRALTKGGATLPSA